MFVCENTFYICLANLHVINTDMKYHVNLKPKLDVCTSQQSTMFVNCLYAFGFLYVYC